MRSFALAAPGLIILAAAQAGAQPDGGSADGPPPPQAAQQRTGHGFDARWSHVSSPSTGPALSIGQPGAGCLEGALELPKRDRDYVIAHPERHRDFGHPDLVHFLRTFAAAAHRQKLAPVYIGDLGQPRGGPTPTGHRSHQNGLDVDLWYGPPLRPSPRGKALEPAPVVDLRTHKMLPAWNRHARRLLALAASQPSVDRIFVNPAVKRALCQERTRAPWLGKLRPWWGHHDHFHVRLRCPASSPQCAASSPLPTGDGCDASLAWWFSADAQKNAARRTPPGESGPVMPERCEALLSELPGRPIQ